MVPGARSRGTLPVRARALCTSAGRVDPWHPVEHVGLSGAAARRRSVGRSDASCSDDWGAITAVLGEEEAWKRRAAVR